MRTEKDICVSFWKQLWILKSTKYFSKDFLIFHVANEQYTSTFYTLSLKRMGLTAGVPDYCIVMPEGKVAFIEFKRDKKAKLTYKQEEFKNKCKELDTPYLLCYSEEDAINFIKLMLNK